MNQEPQSPLWPEGEIKTIGKRDATGTFGERLKRERELRSISLDEIANTTKIGTRMLHALEDEQFDKLPGGIFNKGFVRAYAKYLGLDEEQAVTDYLAAEAEQERKRRAPSDAPDTKQTQPQLFAIQGGSRADNIYNIRANSETEQQQPDQAGGFMMAAVILVFVLGAGGLGWRYYNSHSAGSASAALHEAEPQPSVPTQPTASATQTLGQQQLPADTSISATTPTSSDTAGTTTTPLNNTVASNSVPNTDSKLLAPATKLPATAETQSPATIPAEFTLDLRADEDSWAQITADGKQVWTGVITKDSSQSYRAGKQLVVKLGNPSGVQLNYNGKPLPRFEKDSQSGTKTRTLNFTRAGLASR